MVPPVPWARRCCAPVKPNAEIRETTSRSQGSALALAPWLVGLIPLLFFAPTITGGFLIWDDNVNLLSNPALWRETGAWRWMFTDIESVQRYKPLNWLLWRGLGELFGLNPLAFHAANVVLHAGNAVLLYWVLLTFLSDQRAAPSSRDDWLVLAAALGSLCWSLHPLRVEPVAWISGAGYPLSTFWALLSVRCFQTWLRCRGPVRYWGAWACFALSLLAYPATASLPALLGVLWLLDYQKSSSRSRGIIWEAGRVLAPYVIAAVVLLGLTLLTRISASGEIWHRPVDMAGTGLTTRLFHAITVWVWYLEKTLWPLHLAPVYVDLREFSALSHRALISLGVFGLTVGLLGRWRRVGPEVALLFLAWLLLAIPVLGVADLPFTPSDRYTYLPSITWSFGLARAITQAVNGRRRSRQILAVGAALVLVAIFTARSVGQQRVWRSPITFFQHAQVAITPHPATADLHWRLGLHYLAMEQPEQAQHEFRQVLALDPHHADAARYLRVLQRRELAARSAPSGD